MQKDNFVHIWLRIRQITGWTRQRELAAFLGVRPASISGAKTRNRFPAEWGFRIAERYGINLEWLFTGEGAKCRDNHGGRGGRFECAPEESVKTEWLFPPSYPQARANPPAGNGIPHVRLAVGIGTPPAGPNGLVLIEARDDSMRPTIRRGDLLLVDRGPEKIGEEGIYALEIDNIIQIRRIQMMLDGLLCVKCDNPIYEDQRLEKEAAEERLFGKVLWLTRKVDG